MGWLTGDKGRPSSTMTAKPPLADERGGERETLFVQVANGFFRRFGVTIARRPWTSLAVSTLLTLVASAIIPFTKMSNDVSDFTPNGARARQEVEVYKKFFAGKGEPLALFVLIRAKRNYGGNMLGLRQLEETVRLLDTISTRFTVFNEQTGRNETFLTLCNSFCTINEPIRHFYNGLLIKHNFGRNVTAEHIDLGYPITTVLGRQLHMDPNFFGVKVALRDENDSAEFGLETVVSVNELRAVNGHSIFDVRQAQLKDNIREIRVVGLQFRIERPPSIFTEQLKHWEFQIVHYLQNEFTSEFVEAFLLSEGFLTAEVVRAGLTLLPFLLIGFVIMVLFSSVSMNAAAFYISQLYPHKSLLAFVACICPFMACGTALGVLFWAGFRFGSILCVTPFLVLALGVDDAFLMINSWQWLRRKQLKERSAGRWTGGASTESCQRRVEHLLSEVMIDTGASITITTLTNVLAFSIGALTPTPEIQLFSIGNALAIVIDFIYEWTIFGAAMAIAGRWELAADEAALGEREFLPAGESGAVAEKSAPLDDSNDSMPTSRSNPLYNAGITPSAFRRVKKALPSPLEWYSMRESLQVFTKYIHTQLDDVAPKLVRAYCALIVNGYAASAVLLGLVVYMYVCMYGVLNMRAELKPDRLFLQTSDAIQALGMRNEYIIPFYAICIVFVNRPGNLSDANNVRRLHSLVTDFERLPSSVGQFSTKFWLRDYEMFIEENSAGGPSGDGVHSDANGDGVNEIRQFLDWPEFQFWRGFLQLSDDSPESPHEVHVRRFFFTTASYGPRLVEWSQREQLLNQWRAVADLYPELNVSVYEDDAKFLDLIPAMVPQTVQSSFWTLACMFLVCLLFIRHPTTLLVTNFSIFSCCVGVFGILSLSGIDLDPIVMSSMIMSIGFSVDIPAHISYHFYKSGLRPAGESEPSVEARLRHCIAAISFPILEAGVSTIICVSSLLLVDLHMARVFATTMILVVAIGLVHGLLVIPAVFYLISCLPTARALRITTDSAPPPFHLVSAPSSVESDASSMTSYMNSSPNGILSIRLRP